MNNIINKLKNLRTQTWVSQEDVANYLWVSRLTYMNIESWKREIKEKEISLIADFFEKSESDFIEKNKWESIEEDRNYKLKQLILYISHETQNIKSFWKTVLNKLLYFSDFNYYEWTDTLITGVTYKKLPFWPVPENITLVLNEMIRDWLIAIKEETYHKYTQQKIIPLVEADLVFLSDIDRVSKSESEFDDLPSSKEIIDNVLNKFKYHKATEISEWSHIDKPYKATKNIWDTIRPWLVHYRSEAFIVNPHSL